mmetsp:Transcript_8922/g.22928  ORF Transcript_8922/g.22928 Transcript_8922/m.22928 type:complete len:246 (-) Transcript_8922:1142-1879(-)
MLVSKSLLLYGQQQVPLFLPLQLLLLALARACEVGVPPCLLILLRSFARVLCLVYASADDYNVGSSFDCGLRVVVLLSQAVPALAQLDSWRHLHEALVWAMVCPLVWVHADEANHEVLVLLRHGRRRLGVFTRRHGSLRAHLGEEQQAQAFLHSRKLEALDDAGAGNNVRVYDVRPRGDLVHAAGELGRDCVPDVGELPVLKDEEVVLLREASQALGRGVVPVVEDVDVGLDAAHVGADRVSNPK